MSEDMKADLNAAFDALETSESAPAPAPEPAPSPEPQGVEPTPAPQEAAPEPTGDRPRDEKGRFAPRAEDANPPPAKPVQTAKAPQEAAPKPQEKAPEAQPFKAPQSWKANVRELVQKLPPEFRPIVEEAMRRDRETEGAMREAAEARQITGRLRETLAPFESALRSTGTDPFQAFGQMMRTTMILSSGSAYDKAALVADAIQRYGVDLNMLAARLEGAPVPQGQPQHQGPVRDPRVDDLLSQVEQAKYQRQQRLAGEAQRMVAEIQNEEFFADVKDVMADILETAARRGVAMTPREAYNRAVWADPHVSEVLQQRQAARQAQNPNGSTSRAMAAAASVRGSPAVAVSATQPRDRRGDVEAAFDRLSDGNR